MLSKLKFLSFLVMKISNELKALWILEKKVKNDE